MNLIWKDVLWEGDYRLKGDRHLSLDAADIRNACAQGKAIAGAKLDVPFCWEHDRDTIPHSVEMSAAVYGDKAKRIKWAKGCIAPVVDYRVKSDPTRGEVLEAAFDSSKLSAKELKQIKNCGKVSCYLSRNFRDARGNGQVFPGLSISHVAVTPKPIEPNQGPFQMSSSFADETFCMGEVEEEKPNEEKPPVDEEPPAEVVEEKPVDPASLAALIEAIRGLPGVIIPDEVNNMAGLVIAVKACCAGKEKADPFADDPATAGSTDSTTSANSTPPLMMSQAAMEAERPAIVKADRKSLKRRIGECVKEGRIAPTVADKLTKEFETFQLSYADGELSETGVVAKLAAYEALPAGTVMKPKPDGTYEMSTTQAHDLPAELDRKKEVEDANKMEADIVARTRGVAGLKAK